MFSLLRMFGFLLFHFKYERFHQKYFSHIRKWKRPTRHNISIVLVFFFLVDLCNYDGTCINFEERNRKRNYPNGIHLCRITNGKVSLRNFRLSTIGKTLIFLFSFLKRIWAQIILFYHKHTDILWWSFHHKLFYQLSILVL